MTEAMLLGWVLKGCAATGCVVGAYFGPWLANEDRGGAFLSALAGMMPSVGVSAFAGVILGATLGATVNLHDVPGTAGIGHAFTYGAMSFLLGGLIGIPSGLVGGLVGWQVRGAR